MKKISPKIVIVIISIFVILTYILFIYIQPFYMPFIEMLPEGISILTNHNTYMKGEKVIIKIANNSDSTFYRIHVDNGHDNYYSIEKLIDNNWKRIDTEACCGWCDMFGVPEISAKNSTIFYWNQNKTYCKGELMINEAVSEGKYRVKIYSGEKSYYGSFVKSDVFYSNEFTIK